METSGGSVPGDGCNAARMLGARAWLEMERHDVAPTPRNFELWYTHVAGTDPELSARLDALLASGEPLTIARLDALQDGAPAALDLGGIMDGVEAIDAAVTSVTEQVASGAEHLRRYGDTLAHWTRQLGPNSTVETLVHAVATLTTETARTCERNRTLEQQLHQSSARITRLKESLADVRREATTDPMTNLLNRRTFDMRLRRALKQAKAERSALSVMMLDVDHFKRVNDNHGHNTGDLVLRLIGRLLNESIKGRDTAARYGGEEFAIIMAGADLHASATVANQICSTLAARPIVLKSSGKSIGMVTLSVGVAQFQPGDTAAALLDRADVALYRAKHLGRNQVCTETRAAVAA